MNLDDLTLGQIKELKNLFGEPETIKQKHPMLGRRCFAIPIHDLSEFREV